jgi:preprotein translocase subunit YajC
MLLAQETPPAPGVKPGPLFQFLVNFGPFVLLLLVFWFLVFGANRRRDRERKALLNGLKKGDRVRLIGGEFGAVVEVKDDRVLVKVDETSNTKIWYIKEAVNALEGDAKAS